MSSENLIVAIDTKIFGVDERERQQELSDEIAHFEADMHLVNIAPRFGAGSSFDLIALGGLALSAAALVVSILQLRSAKKTVDRTSLLAEIDAYLRLKGIDDYRVFFEDGFENLVEQNGKICLVGVQLGNSNASLYLAITNDRITIAAVEFDWRAMD